MLHYIHASIKKMALSWQVLIIHGLQCPRDITHLSWRPTAREEISIVIAMKRDVEDARVTVKHFLGAVTMVDILETG